MPHVTIPSKSIDLETAESALQRELGAKYTVTAHEGAHPSLKVANGSMSTAHVRVSQKQDGTHFSVHGGGFMIGRVINEATIARKVAGALRRATAAGA